MDIKGLIRTIPDYPKAGIMFRDVTTLLKDAEGFKYVIDSLYEKYKDSDIDSIVGIEARGFILGAALAYRMGKGFVPIRKKGKLPGDTVEQHYDLEYGTDTMEIHSDALTPGEKVLLVDDLLATGGTAIAGIELIKKLQGKVVSTAFIVDLPVLEGGKKLEELGHEVFKLVDFDGH